MRRKYEFIIRHINSGRICARFTLKHDEAEALYRRLTKMQPVNKFFEEDGTTVHPLVINYRRVT